MYWLVTVHFDSLKFIRIEPAGSLFSEQLAVNSIRGLRWVPLGWGLPFDRVLLWELIFLLPCSFIYRKTTIGNENGAFSPGL